MTRHDNPRPTVATTPPVALIQALLAVIDTGIVSPACADYPPQWWDLDLDEPETPEQKRQRQTLAVEVCADCPARVSCRAVARRSHGLSSPMLGVTGVWAGEVYAPSRPVRVPPTEQQRAARAESGRKAWETRRAAAGVAS